MKKITISFLLFLFIGFLAKSQSISDAIGYYDSQHGKLHYAVILSDNSIWKYSEADGWKTMTKTGLPSANPVQLDTYFKYSMSTSDVELLCLMSDNTEWNFNEDTQKWEAIPMNIPSGSKISVFKPMMYQHKMAWDTKYVAQLSDNSIGYFTEKDGWKAIDTKGIRDGATIKLLDSYVKMGAMGGSSENYVALVDGKSLWYSSDGGKWQKMKDNGLNLMKNTINTFTCILKLGAFSFTSSLPESKIFVSLSDQSLWRYIPGDNSWYDIETDGLPSGYKIKTMRAYEKFGTATAKVQMVACMQDNTMWDYLDKKGWEKISTAGLPLK